MKLGHNEIMITSMYFNNIKDFINLEMGVKRYRGNIERFHFNPIPLNEYSRKLFPNIETFHIYNENDEIFNDGKIFKKVIWYLVKDRYTYGNTIPPEVKSLKYNCFCNCDELKSINIPTTITKLGDGCFDRCSSLKSINIPSSVSKIGGGCFDECTSLTTMNIDNLQFISQERIFINEPVLVSIKIPHNLQIINGKNIEKKDINKFIIPSSITKLGNACFNRCYSLITINIPTYVRYYCFKKCTSLKSINIPSSIKSFGDGCFCECGCEKELKKNKRIPRNCFNK
ncbi:hypothetical protein, conserved [Entamoeba dispar SAW760]|uniref:Leucine rich repeat containing protein BspA family protein n=1 Tax=Entamoeba dispar (strain ATCC PRA-260 / SAW760) TaxID=370354 RepID=B0EJL3_ENTDS|nr:uncharacterized protein EDI_026970 [Entamoeba dispar SAW760]EDR25283.1 hypothetical protein, conserved [Entamoeba dispar SAW760]|eukprot:EDR25283.1 hypothetical protein, conserved [Entamoeba dispar SAW760]